MIVCFEKNFHYIDAQIQKISQKINQK